MPEVMPKYDPEIKCNVRDVYLAEVTIGPDGAYAFGKPEYMEGAMEFSRTPTISSGKAYGDGRVRRKKTKVTDTVIKAQVNQLIYKWRRWMTGTNVSESGVESDPIEGEGKPFAMGWVTEKTNGKFEFIWFLHCIAEPITSEQKQSEDNTVWTFDKLDITALKVRQFSRSYTLVDTEDPKCKDITEKAFFSKVQTSDTIEDVSDA